MATQPLSGDRAPVTMAGSRKAYDKLEGAAVDLDHIKAICEAIADAAQDVYELTGRKGATPNHNLNMFANRLLTLSCLQNDCIRRATKKVGVGIEAWPL